MDRTDGKLKTRLKERKWAFAALLGFWVLAIALRRELFSSAAGTVFTCLVLAASFAAVLLTRGTSGRDFLCIACLLGIFFVVLAPFACIIDEKYHFARAFSLSEGQFFHQTSNGKLGFWVPAGYAEYAGYARWNPSNFGRLRDIWLSSARNVEFIPHTRSASYLPTDYVFSALGVGLAKLLNLPLLFVVLFGRLFNYAAYVGIAYAAIRKARYYQSLFFLVAVLPSCLYSGAVFSIDAVLIACCLLYVSVALNCCLDDSMTEISVRDTVLLCVSALFILSTKYFGYFPVLFLILFAGGRHLRNYRRLLLFLGIVTVGIGVWQIGMISAVPGSIDEGAAFESVSLTGQLEWIRLNPGTFLRQTVQQILNEASQQLYAYSYSEEPAFSALSLPLRFVPFFAAAWAEDKSPMSLKQRRGLNLYWIGSAFLMLLVCYVGLYLAWTPVGASNVEGMQFRYSTPYLIFILLMISTIRTESTIQNKERIVSFLMILQLVNMLTGTMLHWR